MKELSILCKGGCKLLGSLNSFLSKAPLLSGAKPVSPFTLKSERGHRWLILAFSPAPQPLSDHRGVGGGGGIFWITVLGAHIHICPLDCKEI